eukprot:gnl/TRDRNA2_/TRDRNA2_173495_c0_seq2.p1 gnl/TRDRNA2_/TRDRNA2_173495_c0~~gnl/TRDRNA2_/TRDRNA2_173495_c0_seq2.p1  ORF type:complete len:327 (+),score=69.09 gnl/TRDRNA2_/TRDRNA2_173495_c0_seq2:43-1023(+)
MMPIGKTIVFLACLQLLHATDVQTIIKKWQASHGGLAPQVPSFAVPYLQATIDNFKNNRRLDAHSESVPQACIDKCPSAKAIKDDMDATATKAFASMAKVQPKEGEELTPEKTQALLKELDTAMFEIMYASFQTVCKNPDGAKCMSENPGVCGQAEEEQNQMSGLESSVPPELVFECVCNKCPDSKGALAKATAGMMSMMLTAFLTMGAAESMTEEESKKMQEDMMKSVMEAMCPMVGAAECLEGAGPACAALAGGMMNGMGGEDGEAGIDKSTCDAMGVSTDPKSVATPEEESPSSPSDAAGAAKKSYVASMLLTIAAAAAQAVM